MTKRLLYTVHERRISTGVLITVIVPGRNAEKCLVLVEKRSQLTKVPVDEIIQL